MSTGAQASLPAVRRHLSGAHSWIIDLEERDEFTQSLTVPQASGAERQKRMSYISRRSFLGNAVPVAFGLHAIVRAQVPIERGRFSEADVPLAREQLLRMVNEERSRAGLGNLELDGLACNVASDHALDMAKGEFLSHWGSD